MDQRLVASPSMAVGSRRHGRRRRRIGERWSTRWGRLTACMPQELHQPYMDPLWIEGSSASLVTLWLLYCSGFLSIVLHAFEHGGDDVCCQIAVVLIFLQVWWRVLGIFRW
uniref:Uncharacterized protein n=1 Tax=Oryza punctata TaxID=4537 RepID=A0A0E0JJC6_ORYPU